MWRLVIGSLLLTSTAFAQRNMNEARPEIRSLISEATASYWTDAQVDSSWNRAQQLTALFAGILIMKYDSITITSSTDKYALPSDFYRMRAVWRGTGPNKSAIRLVDDPFTLESEGVTSLNDYAYIHGTNIFIFPFPAGTNRLYVLYYGQPPLLADTGTATSIPIILRQAPIWLAASFLINQNYNYDVADKYYKRASDIIQQYRGLLSNEGNKGQPAK